LFYFYCVFLLVLSEFSEYDKFLFLFLSLSLVLTRTVFLFSFQAFYVPSLSFSELLLTFEVYLSAHRSHRVVRLARQLAASIQTLHLVHYEYHDCANLFGMAIFKTGNCEQRESHKSLVYYFSASFKNKFTLNCQMLGREELVLQK